MLRCLVAFGAHNVRARTLQFPIRIYKNISVYTAEAARVRGRASEGRARTRTVARIMTYSSRHFVPRISLSVCEFYERVISVLLR